MPPLCYPESEADRLVPVCASCLTASCLLGSFRCEGWNETETEKPLGELQRLDLEHPDFWEVRDAR